MIFDINPSSKEIVFESYQSLAEKFCDLLFENTGLQATALCESQYPLVRSRLSQMTEDKLFKKYQHFESYFEFCKQLVHEKTSLCDNATCLKAFLYRYQLQLPDQDEIFQTIGPNCFIEVYDNEFTQVYRSADFFEVTSHSVLTLEFCEWFDLFQRSKDLTSDQLEVVTKIFSGAIKVPVYKPIEDHSVKEINSKHPRSSQAEIVLYSPLFGADGEFHGILHVFKVLDSRSLEFKLI